jgi:doubled CXXCH motif protein
MKTKESKKSRSSRIWTWGRISVSALLLILLTQTVWGKATGPCVDCHTMHNSQDGSSVIDIGLQPALTNNDCVGCHTNDSATIKTLSGGSKVPIVLTTSPPGLEQGNDNSMLAGGNFYWVAQGDDTKGHNVYGISAVDTLLSNAPGGISCNNCHNTLAKEGGGCLGCHLPAHHADDSAVVVDGEHGSYRFLGDVMTPLFGASSSQGVKGIEDSDWEQTHSATDHNTYSGTTVVFGQETNPFLANSGIGEVCTGCHGNFHHEMNTDQDSLAGLWIRHPSDVLIPDSGEYADYTEYNPLAPVAKVEIDAGMKNSSVVTPGTDIVTCISCHRPHGSPYPDMLRWDYASCQAGTAGSECGCFICHTAKDD